MIFLKIDSKPADIEAESLVLNLLNPKDTFGTERQGNFADPITLPATQNNLKLFGHPDILSATGKFAKTYTAEILADEILLFEGVFQLTSVTSTRLTGSLYAAEQDWMEQIKGKTLREINSFEPAPFIGSVAGDYNYEWYLNRTSADVDLQFPLIAYGNFPDKTWTSARNVASIQQIDFSNYLPSFYLINVIKHIFQDIEWKVRGEIFDNLLAQNLLIPFTSDQPFQWPWKYFAKATRTSTGTTISDNQAGSFMDDFDTHTGTNPMGVQYIVPTNGNYTFTDTVNITNPAGAGLGNVPCFQALQVYTANFGTQKYTATQNRSVLPGGSDTFTLSLNRDLEAGDLVVFTFITFPINYSDLEYSRTTDANPEFGQNNIEIAPNLPKTDQLEFVKSFTRLFNLKIVPNYRQRIMGFVNANLLQTPFNKTINLDSKSLLADALLTSSQNYKMLKFAYRSDSSDAMLAEDTGFANYNLLPGKKDWLPTVNVDVLFAPTRPRKFQFLANGTSSETILEIPCLAAKSELSASPDKVVWDYNFVPRLLVFKGLAQDAKGSNLLVKINGRDSPIGLATFEEPDLYWKSLVENNYLPLPIGGYMLEVKSVLSPTDFDNLAKGYQPAINSDGYYLLAIKNYKPASSEPATLLLVKPEFL